MVDCGMPILFFSFFLSFVSSVISAEGGLSQQGTHLRFWISCTVHQLYANAKPLLTATFPKQHTIPKIIIITSITMIYLIRKVKNKQPL